MTRAVTGLRSFGLALAAGALFGFGLVLSGMTRPDKIVGFLDFFGAWDPTLVFVMATAVGGYMLLHRVILQRDSPVHAAHFALPSRRELDAPLLVGSGLFGAGWGLAGYCPGPALTSVGALLPEALTFVAAMIAGFALERAARVAWSSRAGTKGAEPEGAT